MSKSESLHTVWFQLCGILVWKGSDGESEKINQYSVWGWTAGTPGFLGQ